MDIAMEPRRPTIAEIQAAAAAEFHIPLAAMTAESRAFDYAHPRQAAMALALELTGRGSSLIGRLFGGRDHTTVLHARKVVARRRAEDPALDARLRSIEVRFRPPSPPVPIEAMQLAFLDGPLFDRVPA